MENKAFGVILLKNTSAYDECAPFKSKTPTYSLKFMHIICMIWIQGLDNETVMCWMIHASIYAVWWPMFTDLHSISKSKV